MRSQPGARDEFRIVPPRERLHTCAACGGPVAEGADNAVYDSDTGAWHHDACPPSRAQDRALRREYLDGAPGAERPAPGARSAPRFAVRYTDDESAVLSLIVAAGGRMVPILELAAKTGIRERGVRYVIRDLVVRGEPIITQSGPGGGAAWCEDPAAFAAARARLRKEALALLWRLSAEERSGILEEIRGQMRMEEEP